MASKKRRRKHPGLAWRVLFGQHGPTKKTLKKAAANMIGPKTIASIAHDPVTGKLVTKNLRVDRKTGVISIVPPAKKSAKKTAASKSSRASVPSKPSRAGQVQRRASATSVPAQSGVRQPKAKSMTERVADFRNADGTLNGSAPAVDPLVKAQQDYERALRHAARLERITDRDLGWDQRDRGV